MNKPIEKLYIYELSGEYRSEQGPPGRGFIGCWNEAGYSYLFFSEPAGDLIEGIIAQNSGLKFLSLTEMDYDQWEPADALKPFDVPPLRFVPAWMESGESHLTIKLDPGVVFGAGTHHTTRKCLEFLADLMKAERIEKVADIGTGTGILALAAARLGAREVAAVDNNNLAVETARKNISLNGLGGIIECTAGNAPDFIEAHADLVIANIVTWVLLDLFRPDVSLRASWYIVSGIKGDEIFEFIDRIKTLPLKIHRREQENIWTTLLLKNTYE